VQTPNNNNPNNPNSPLALAVEHILIGFALTGDQTADPNSHSPWGSVDHNKNGDRFGYEITRMLRPGISPINDPNVDSEMATGWYGSIDMVPTANSNIAWGFRQMSIFL